MGRQITKFHGLCAGCGATTEVDTWDWNGWVQTGHVRVGTTTVMADWCPSCQRQNGPMTEYHPKGRVTPKNMQPWIDIVKIDSDRRGM